MKAREERVRRVNAGRYDLGPYQIVRAHWNAWEIWEGREIGCRVNSLIDVRPTKRLAVELVRAELIAPLPTPSEIGWRQRQGGSE